MCGCVCIGHRTWGMTADSTRAMIFLSVLFSPSLAPPDPLTAQGVEILVEGASALPLPK